MHHRKTYMYINFQQNRVSISVKTVHTNLCSVLLGILLLSGYHTLPQTSNYWSTQPDLGVPAVYNVMTRNRFTEIKKYLHLADNQHLQAGDKLSKVSHMYKILIDELTQFGVFSALLSIDESMVPYYGRHCCEMFTEVSRFVLLTNYGMYVVMTDILIISSHIKAKRKLLTLLP